MKPEEAPTTCSYRLTEMEKAEWDKAHPPKDKIEFTLEQKDKAYGELLGTSGVYDTVVTDELNITEERLEELMEEMDACRCGCCGWWVEISECEEHDGEANVCEDCRE